MERKKEMYRREDETSLKVCIDNVDARIAAHQEELRKASEERREGDEDAGETSGNRFKRKLAMEPFSSWAGNCLQIEKLTAYVGEYLCRSVTIFEIGKIIVRNIQMATIRNR